PPPPSVPPPSLSTPPSTTHTYTPSLHDALPICPPRRARLTAAGGAALLPPGTADRPAARDAGRRADPREGAGADARRGAARDHRSEEHTSELQSRGHLVCRLLLEKKKKTHDDR